MRFSVLRTARPTQREFDRLIWPLLHACIVQQVVVGRSKVELFEAIRRDHAAGGMSIRGLADRHGVHRRTVRQALVSAVLPERKMPTRSALALDP